MTRQLNLRLLLFYGPILCFLEITCDPSLPVNPSEISERILLLLQEMCAKPLGKGLPL